MDRVSSRLMVAGDTVAMMEVLVLPPRESCSNLNRIGVDIRSVYIESNVKFKLTWSV